MQAEIGRAVKDRGKEIPRNMIAQPKAFDVVISGVRLVFGFGSSVLARRLPEVEPMDILNMDKHHGNLFTEPTRTVNRLESDVKRVTSKSEMNEALIELDESWHIRFPQHERSSVSSSNEPEVIILRKEDRIVSPNLVPPNIASKQYVLPLESGRIFIINELECEEDSVRELPGFVESFKRFITECRSSQRNWTGIKSQ
jgi:hypothetical protein